MQKYSRQLLLTVWSSSNPETTNPEKWLDWGLYEGHFVFSGAVGLGEKLEMGENAFSRGLSTKAD